MSEFIPIPPENLGQSSTEIAPVNPALLSDYLLERRGVVIQVHEADQPYTMAIWDHPDTKDTLQLNRFGIGAGATYTLAVTAAKSPEPHTVFTYASIEPDTTHVEPLSKATLPFDVFGQDQQKLAVSSLLRTGILHTADYIQAQFNVLTADFRIHETHHPKGSSELTAAAGEILADIGDDYSNDDMERSSATWTKDNFERVMLTKIHAYGEEGYFYILKVFGKDPDSPVRHYQYDAVTGSTNKVVNGHFVGSSDLQRAGYLSDFLGQLYSADIEFSEAAAERAYTFRHAAEPYVAGHPLDAVDANSFWKIASHYMATITDGDTPMLSRIEQASKLRYGLLGGFWRSALQENIVDDILRIESTIPIAILRSAVAEEIQRRVTMRKDRLYIMLGQLSGNPLFY